MAAGTVPAIGVLTVLASTDVHGHLNNWNYFAGSPYPDDPRATGGQAEPPLGMDRVAGIVRRVRGEREPGSVVVLDDGDVIQGTPLSYLAARPDLAPGGHGLGCDPMARALDLIGYDAVTIGNHEFNYGLDRLRAFAGDLDAPLLGANVIDAATGAPLTGDTVLLERAVAGHPVRVGIIGVTTPGSAVWDRAHLAGRVELTDPVQAAARCAARLREAGADVVILAAHTGLDEPGRPPVYKGMAENAATTLASTVAGIDLVIAGHTHAVAQAHAVDGADGHPVLIAQPGAWASALARIDIPLRTGDDGTILVDHTAVGGWAASLPTATAGPDPQLTGDPLLAAAHQATLDYLDTPVAVCTTELSAANATVADTAILDLVAQIQADTVAAALAGLGAEGGDGLPVLAQVSPFSRTAVLPAGPVRLRQVAGLYPFENTLSAIRLIGAQIRDYLEHAAGYYAQVGPGTPIDPAPADEGGLTRATRAGRTVWDYNYDALTGVCYRIDVTRPAGSRIRDLSWQGAPLDDRQPFALALGSYRLAGGGDYPHVRQAPMLWDSQLEIRQLLIETVTARGTIDPADFFVENWRITTGD